jgi:hypothetical protein
MGGWVCHVMGHSLCHTHTFYSIYITLFFIFIFNFLYIDKYVLVHVYVSIYMPGLSVRALCSRLCLILIVFMAAQILE